MKNPRSRKDEKSSVKTSLALMMEEEEAYSSVTEPNPAFIVDPGCGRTLILPHPAVIILKVEKMAQLVRFMTVAGPTVTDEEVVASVES